MLQGKIRRGSNSSGDLNSLEKPLIKGFPQQDLHKTPQESGEESEIQDEPGTLAANLSTPKVMVDPTLSVEHAPKAKAPPQENPIGGSPRGSLTLSAGDFEETDERKEAAPSSKGAPPAKIRDDALEPPQPAPKLRNRKKKRSNLSKRKVGSPKSAAIPSLSQMVPAGVAVELLKEGMGLVKEMMPNNAQAAISAVAREALSPRASPGVQPESGPRSQTATRPSTRKWCGECRQCLEDEIEIKVAPMDVFRRCCSCWCFGLVNFIMTAVILIVVLRMREDQFK